MQQAILNQSEVLCLIRTYSINLCSGRVVPVIDDNKHEIIYMPRELFLSLLKGDLSKLQEADKTFRNAVHDKDYFIAEFSHVGARAVIEEYIPDGFLELDEPLPVHKSFCLKGCADSRQSS